MSTLIGYWGGRAATGATYEIEITRTEDGQIMVTPYSAGGGGSRKQQGCLYTGTDLTAANTALIKQATKKRNGRERAYINTVADGPCPTGWVARVNAAGELPVHEQIWVTGRDMATLPAHLHRAVGAMPVTPTTPVPTPSPVTATVVGGVVALCDRADAAKAEVLMADENFIATRKVEGQRAQIHKVNGAVVMTNRIGGEINCPVHIADVAAGLADGTSLDGELVAMTDDGRECLYAGAAATKQMFVAFDLVADPSVAMATAEPQMRRLHLLSLAVESLGVQSAIQVVEIAVGTEEKRTLLERARADGWEGLVFRRHDAPYAHGRGPDWVKFKLRYETIDAVVMGYRRGKGRLAASVGAVKVGLYNDAGVLVSIGEVGSGWTDAQRAELQRRCDAGTIGYVIEVKAEGLTAGKKLLRPIAVAIRPDGDKAAADCRMAA